MKGALIHAMMFLAFSLSGCSTTTVPMFVQEPLPIPDRPVLPTVKADDLACLSDEAYGALVQRDAVLAAHVRRLEAIIKTTH